jgi:hypothetical protein
VQRGAVHQVREILRDRHVRVDHGVPLPRDPYLEARGGEGVAGRGGVHPVRRGAGLDQLRDDARGRPHLQRGPGGEGRDEGARVDVVRVLVRDQHRVGVLQDRGVAEPPGVQHEPPVGLLEPDAGVTPGRDGRRCAHARQHRAR